MSTSLIMAISSITIVLVLILFGIYVAMTYTIDSKYDKLFVTCIINIMFLIPSVIFMYPLSYSFEDCTYLYIMICTMVLLNILIVIFEIIRCKKDYIKTMKSYETDIVYTSADDIINKIVTDYTNNSVELNSSYFDFNVRLSSVMLLNIYIELVEHFNDDKIVWIKEIDNVASESVEGNQYFGVMGNITYPVIPPEYHDYEYCGKYSDFLLTVKNDANLYGLFRLANPKMLDDNVILGHMVDFIW